MTCREFKQNAETLTLWELVRTQDEHFLNHAQQCEGCGGWLREQRAMAASLQTLQARTAALEASPKVEAALLQAFRQKAAQGVAVAQSMASPALANSEQRKAKSETLTRAPFALRLSRWFEIGAYAAVAAAIAVGLFLGVRLVQRNSKPAPVQSQTSPAASEPEVPQPAAAAQPQPQTVTPSAASAKRVASVPRREAMDPPATVIAARQQNASQESQADESGYLPLMFCDPLSCAADSQVVRMELPANPASQSPQPQLADVVVGYDGVVRAVRMVN